MPPTVEDGAKLEVVHDESGTLKRFFEGPSYDTRTEALYFTAFGKDGTQLLRLEKDGKLTVYLDDSGGLNGTFLSRKGGLLGCQGDRGRLVRVPLRARPVTESELEALAGSFEGKPLLKPNDLCEDPRGRVYFTCPDFKEGKQSAVYCLTLEGKLERLPIELQAPNGIELAKGDKALYVADSGTGKVHSYPRNPVTGEVDAKGGKVFLDPSTEARGGPDGMTLDERGNLYVAGRGGVWVAAPDGKVLGLISIPEFCSNVAFGGPAARTLFMTCQSKVYRLPMKLRGWEAASRHELGASPIKFKARLLDPVFRSEGAAIADVNRDGKADVLVGDLWYEAPAFTPREIRKPGTYDGAKGYSECFGCFSDDWTGDGYPDLVVIPFPGQNGYWYENPRGKNEHWKAHELWHSVCNETPLHADLLGNGKRQLVFAWQARGKENEGTLGYFTPPAEANGPAEGRGAWQAHAISELRAPGTHRFSHGLGVGDVNGDGRNDVIITAGWWEQPPAGTAGVWKLHRAPLGPDAADMHAYDLNNDGLNDVISSSAHGYGIWWHEQRRGPEGRADWTTHLIDDSFSQSHALHLVDLNGDGTKDLLTGKRYFAHQGHDPGEFEPVVLYWIEVKRGSPPRFIPHLLELGVGIATQFAVGDLNGDGLLDIAVSSKRGVHLVEQLPPGTARAE